MNIDGAMKPGKEETEVRAVDLSGTVVERVGLTQKEKSLRRELQSSEGEGQFSQCAT